MKKSLREEAEKIIETSKEQWSTMLGSAIIRLKLSKIGKDRNKLDAFKYEIQKVIELLIKSKMINNTLRLKINKLKNQISIETSFVEEVDVYIDILSLVKDEMDKHT